MNNKSITLLLLPLFFSTAMAANSNASNKTPLSPLNLIAENKITPANLTANSRFGYPVFVSDGKALVSAASFNNDTGKVFVFELQNGQWVNTGEISANDSAAGDLFGYSVHLAGDTAIIGAPRDDDNGTDDSGSVYVFSYNGNSWVQEAKLTSPDPKTSGMYGYSLARKGNEMVIGQPNPFGLAGAAYVYQFSNGVWSVSQTLVPTNTDFGSFGNSVDITESHLAVGDPNDNTSKGTAYLFQKTGSTWTPVSELSISGASPYTYFGVAVKLFANQLAVGAYNDSSVAPNMGAVYAYSFDGSAWNQTQKITPSDGIANQYFGYALDLDENRLYIGAYLDDDNGQHSGSVYAYEYANSNGWQQLQKLVPDQVSANDWFGASVSQYGGRLLAGALQDDFAATNAGATYAFTFDLISHRSNE